MSLPGVVVNVQNGNLGLQPQSAEQSMIYVGPSILGVANTLNYYGDQQSLVAAQGAGEVAEAATYELSAGGSIVGILNTAWTSGSGGLSAVVHGGSGSGTMTVACAPHKQILITITTTGALTVGKFTYQVGSGSVSAPITLAGTYQVPGTYTTLTFPAGTYTSGDTYTISILGVVTFASGGGSDRSVTQASIPLDAWRPVITITTAGALATAQFTYALDGAAANTSPPILTTSGGTYALPDTGVYVSMGGSMTLGDTYTFSAIGPTCTNSDMVSALNTLKTTYLSSPYSMVAKVGNLSGASSQAALLAQFSSMDTVSTALNLLGVFPQFFAGAPTLGTITASGGTVAVDAVSTDAALSTARLSMASRFVSVIAGDGEVQSAINGLSFRRNGSWGASGRASAVIASQNIGAVSDGALHGFTSIYRNEEATPGLDAVGYITLRSYAGSVSSGTGLPGFYITDGHTMDVVTSDYYPLANKRVMDKACATARATALPLVNSKIPTTTRNGIAGVISEVRAQQIDSLVTSALTTTLVNTEPADAVAAKAVTNRTHPLTDGNLIIDIAIQVFLYGRIVTLNIGLALSV